MSIQQLHYEKTVQFNNIEDIKSEKQQLDKRLKEKKQLSVDEIQSIKKKIYELTLLEKNVNEYIFSNYELLSKYETIENRSHTSSSPSQLCDILSKKTPITNESNKKLNIIDQYLINNNKYSKNMKYNNRLHICDHCENPLNNMKEESENIICTNCGKISVLFREEYKSNKNENMIIRNSIYVRKNHFREWLNNLQGKSSDSKKISDELILLIQKEIKIMKIEIDKVTKKIIRKILKKNKLSKYYDYEIQILYLVNGKKPIMISKNTETILTEYFEMTEIAFEEYKKKEKGRKNLLRYSYILYKLCELLELDEYLSHFSLLKNRLKKLEQDKIWKFICEYNNWTFYQTV